MRTGSKTHRGTCPIPSCCRFERCTFLWLVLTLGFPASLPNGRRRRRTHAAAQSRSRAIGSRRHPAAQRRVQPRAPRSSTPAISSATPTGASSTRWSSCRSAATRSICVTLKEELGRSGELDEVGGPAYITALVDGVPRYTNVEHYARHHQGEGDPPEPDLLREQDPRDRVRGAEDEADADPRSGRARDLRDRRRQGARRLRVAARPGAGQPRHHREAARAQGADHRRADRLHRSRRDDVGPAAVGPGHHRGAPVDGEDQPGAEHGAARRHQDRHDGRRVQPRNVEGAAVPAHADRRGADRRAPAARRVPRRARLGPAVAGDRHAERGEDLHRRHAVDRRARDAREMPAAGVRARPAPGHHRLRAADAGPRPVREPHPRARLDLALAEGARQGAARADRRCSRS